MKKLPSVKAMGAVIVIFLILLVTPNVAFKDKEIKTSSTKNDYEIRSNMASSMLLNEVMNANEEVLSVKEEELSQTNTEKEVAPSIVYDNMTLEQLGAKLDRSLKSTLTGYGLVFAELSIRYTVDPYVALAIVLHETGCDSGRCSSLTSQCNNVGGMRSQVKCGNSGYGKFPSLSAGIEAFFKNLSENYYQKGLDTPEKIGKKYAESSTWPTKIRYYMQKIQAT